ncbi:MAG: hypothetical protein JKY93_06255 [Gammaproteobacteria bacterium]|nr:hypothetical protein [Gammaproteobacteria bacterium]
MAVFSLGDSSVANVEPLLAKFGLSLILLAEGETIDGSFWGDSEAGLIANKLYARPDTPVHSVFHEACHYICMDEGRRQMLDTNAAGDYAEENAVCYLQVLLATHVPGFDDQRMFSDMDEWGYSFRLGSAKKWFFQDAEDARLWLLQHKIIANDNSILWQLRK